MTSEARILADRRNIERPTGPRSADGDAPIMLNKANLKEVSSLRFQVSSRRGQASNHPTSHLKLHTSKQTPYGVTTNRTTH
jgi:hypothetical protein